MWKLYGLNYDYYISHIQNSVWMFESRKSEMRCVEAKSECSHVWTYAVTPQRKENGKSRDILGSWLSLSLTHTFSLIIQLYTSSRNRKELSHSHNASNASTHPHHSYQNYEDIRRWKRRRYWTRMAQKSLLSKSITKSDTEMIERKDKPSDVITREQLYSSLSNISTHRWIRLQMHYNITKVLDIDVKESLFIAFG
jgi:hypothetical protein